MVGMDWKTTHFTNRSVRIKDYEPLPELLAMARVALLFGLVALACVWVAYGPSVVPFLCSLSLGGALFWCRCDDLNRSEMAMNKPLEGKEEALKRRCRYLLGEAVVVTLLWTVEVVLALHFHLSLLQFLLAGLAFVAFVASRWYPAFLWWTVLLALSGEFA